MHRTEVIMLRSVLVLCTFPQTDTEMLIWRSGRAAAAGVAAVLPDHQANVGESLQQHNNVTKVLE